LLGAIAQRFTSLPVATFERRMVASWLPETMNREPGRTQSELMKVSCFVLMVVEGAICFLAELLLVLFFAMSDTLGNEPMV
jgi:hypothetical protein